MGDFWAFPIFCKLFCRRRCVECFIFADLRHENTAANGFIPTENFRPSNRQIWRHCARLLLVDRHNGRRGLSVSRPQDKTRSLHWPKLFRSGCPADLLPSSNYYLLLYTTTYTYYILLILSTIYTTYSHYIYLFNLINTLTTNNIYCHIMQIIYNRRQILKLMRHIH